MLNYSEARRTQKAGQSAKKLKIIGIIGVNCSLTEFVPRFTLIKKYPKIGSDKIRTREKVIRGGSVEGAFAIFQ